MHPPALARIATPLGLALSFGLAHAGPDSWGIQKNRFSFSPRAGFSMEANFSKLGGFPARTDPGPEAAGFDHVYDDGYNRVDSSGNVGGATWNWGYDRASQVVNGDTLVFSSTSAAGIGELNGVSEDPQWSAEITYARELGWNKAYWWGFVAALSWTDLRFGESATLTTDAIRTRDSYDILGPLPAAPYQGAFSPPGPQISDTPSRVTSVLPGGAVTRGDYELEGTGYGLRLGLLFETPFTDWFDFQFGGGVAGMWIQSDLTVNETTTIIEAGSVSQRRSGSDDDLSVGGYGELGVSLRLAKHLNLHAGMQYYYLTDYTHRLGDEEATLDLKSSLFAVLGFTYSF
jgi:hypothetical protein